MGVSVGVFVLKPEEHNVKFGMKCPQSSTPWELNCHGSINGHILALPKCSTLKFWQFTSSCPSGMVC